VIDPAVVAEAVPAWHQGLMHARGKERGGLSNHASTHETVDDILARHGIVFGTELDGSCVLWARYEKAIRKAAKARYGIVTNQRPRSGSKR